MKDTRIEDFRTLKSLMKEYEDRFIVKTDLEGRYELWALKDVVIEGRKRKEVFFASAIIQGSYVGFYFMPVYVDEEVKSFFPPSLLKLLKGKSCFHIRGLDERLETDLKAALERGALLYESRGWTEARGKEDGHGS